MTPRPGVDPLLKRALDAVPFQLLGDEGIESARRRLRELRARVPAALVPNTRFENRHLDVGVGVGGGVGVRIYWPPDVAEGEILPLLMFFHGGGFAVGDLDTHDIPARLHCLAARAVVVSVDYRLAPEHPYPAATDDAMAATRWAAAHAAELGADPGRMAVAGDSAGGTIAAVVAQQARDAGGPPITYQLLWYPPTQWDMSLPSYTENADAPILDRSAMEQFRAWYAGHLDQDNPPPAAAPGRNPDLAGLPPAYIAVAGHDPLRDDGICYAERLRAAGVPVELDNALTLVHGYITFSGIIPAATAATERGLKALRAALHG